MTEAVVAGLVFLMPEEKFESLERKMYHSGKAVGAGIGGLIDGMESKKQQSSNKQTTDDPGI